MSLLIRPARADDCFGLTAVAHAAKRHWGYPPEWIAAWREELTVTPAYLAAHRVVAGFEGTALAAFYALEAAGGGWRLGHFWVEPRWIGMGIGRWMFYDCVRRAREARPGPLRIEADPHAEGFYLRMGARRVGTVPAPVEGDPARVLPVLELDTAAWMEPHPSLGNEF